jgi:DNA polymerase-3 subunit alpha
MKANFPAIYMASALSAESGVMETVADYIKECKRMGLEVLPPDVNESFKGFTDPNGFVLPVKYLNEGCIRR